MKIQTSGACFTFPDSGAEVGQVLAYCGGPDIDGCQQLCFRTPMPGSMVADLWTILALAAFAFVVGLIIIRATERKTT
jgi:hypothetical protein